MEFYYQLPSIGDFCKCHLQNWKFCLQILFFCKQTANRTANRDRCNYLCFKRVVLKFRLQISVFNQIQNGLFLNVLHLAHERQVAHLLRKPYSYTLGWIFSANCFILCLSVESRAVYCGSELSVFICSLPLAVVFVPWK